MRIARTILAPLAGYFTIVLGTSLTFGTFGDVKIDSPPNVIIAGTIGAILSGLAGGALAALIAPSRRFAHAAAVLIFIAVDTAFVLANFPGPWWLDLIGSTTLAVAALAGGFAVAKFKRTAPATAQ